MNTLADIARWQRVKHILGQALDLPTGQRQAFLRSQAADDGELQQLQALQAAGAADHALLDGGREQLFAQPGVRVPHHLLADTPPPEADGFSANWTGRRVGPYRLLGLIARGGMGQVYRAERVVPADGEASATATAMGQAVAVKLVREGWVGSALQRRFHAERRILERLDHPNLARLLDGGIHADMPYLVMELVDGEAIDVHCRRHALDVPAVLRLFLMLCEVVHYAHGQGVVHRDLKPGNVLVTREGQVKLLDFGIAKQLAGFTPAGESTATVTALRVMTLACASPEQVRGLAVTPASDVYSLGVLLFRLLTGQLPYRFGDEDTAGNDLDLRNAICKAPPPRPSQVPQNPPARQRALRGNLDAVLLKALRKDPARRYPSAAALADELRRHLDQRTVQARWPRAGALGGLGRLFQQPRARRGTLLAGGLLLAAGAAVGLLAWQQARTQAARTEAEWASIESQLQSADALLRQATTPAALRPARQQLQQALQSLDRLHAPASADPTQRFAALDQLRRQAVQDAALSARLAQAYGRIGLAQAGSDGLGLDDPAAAERSLRRALTLFGPAVVGSTDPTHMAALRHDWAAAQAALSGLLQLQGRTGEALALAREALANARQAAGPDTERVLANAELALARALDPVAAGAEVQGLLRAALYRLETLRHRQPADAGLALAVAAVHRQQGLALLRADDSLPPGAHPAAHGFLLAVLMLTPAAAGPSPAPAAQLALALAHHGLAQALQRGQPVAVSPSQGGEDGSASALASATQARDAVHALWRTAPQQTALHWHLADVSATLGRLQLAAGAADAAVQTARTAVDAAPASDTLAPDDHASRGRMGWAWYGLGQALVARASATGMAAAAVNDQPPSDWLRVCDSYRRALVLLEPLRAVPYGQAPVPDAARLIEMRQVLRTCPAP